MLVDAVVVDDEERIRISIRGQQACDRCIAGIPHLRPPPAQGRGQRGAHAPVGVDEPPVYSLRITTSHPVPSRRARRIMGTRRVASADP